VHRSRAAPRPGNAKAIPFSRRGFARANTVSVIPRCERSEPRRMTLVPHHDEPRRTTAPALRPHPSRAAGAAASGWRTIGRAVIARSERDEAIQVGWNHPVMIAQLDSFASARNDKPFSRRGLVRSSHATFPELVITGRKTR
jgi:hypothetical protein